MARLVRCLVPVFHKSARQGCTRSLAVHILLGMSDFSRRNTRETGLAPAASTPDSAGYEQSGGNAAVQERMKVEGAMGRTFNRIAGVSEGNTDASNLAFQRDDLKGYLKDQLTLASGEFFPHLLRSIK